MKNAIRLFISLVLALTFIFTVAINEAKAEKKVFKFSVYYTEDHNRTKLWREYCDRVAEVTKGEIEFKIFSGQSLVKAKQEYEAMISGAIDMCGNAYITGYQPWFTYSQLLGYYMTYAEQMELLRKIRPIIERELDKSGIKLLWVHPAALLSFYSNKGFIKTMDDFKGLKVRVGGTYLAKAFKTFGAGVVSLSTAEQYTALQRGTVDATYVGTDSYLGFNLYEVAPYISNFEHPVFLNPIMMNKKAWNKISEQHKKKILEVGEAFMDMMPKRVMAEEDRINKEVLTRGAMLYNPQPVLRKTMADLIKPLWMETFKAAGTPGEEIYKIIKNMFPRFRENG